MKSFKNIKIILSFLTLIFLASPSVQSAEECFEGTSRAIFKFNMALDDIILEPLAKGYNKLPSPIRAGTSNFTSNIGTLLSIPNNILQGEFKQLGHSVGSFAINTTVGIFGIFNPAEKIGLKPTKDVGQTLGSYGIGPGCYFVLQFWVLQQQETRLDFLRYFYRSICTCNTEKKSFLVHLEIPLTITLLKQLVWLISELIMTKISKP